MEAIWILVILGIGAAAAVSSFSRWSKARAAWEEYARRRGYAFDAGSLFRSRAVRGPNGPFAVTLDTHSKGSGDSQRTYTRLVVDSRGHVPHLFAVSKEGMLSSFQKAFGGQDVETGDASFDAAALVRGDEIAALALLDRATRGALESAIAAGTKVESGAISWETPGYVDDAGAIAAKEDELVALAHALSMGPGDAAARLSAIARDLEEPAPLRRRCLDTLFERHAGSPEALAAARAALGDPSPAVRLAAALAAGAEGHATLAALALDAAAPEPVRAPALAAAARAGDEESARRVVLAALDLPPGETLRAALREAGRIGGADVVPRLARLADRVDGLDAATATALAEAVDAIRDPALEGTAIALLAAGEGGARLAAIRALGAVGGRGAVEPLLPFARGILPFGGTKAAALGAIRAIQARLEGGERGSLAIAEILRAEGGLTEPATEGRLSPAPRDAEREAER